MKLGMHPYNQHYYDTALGPIPYSRHAGRWLQFFGAIANQVIKKIGPKRVLDAGCAKGFLVEALRDRGAEAYGIDLSEYAIEEVRRDIRPYCRAASLVDPIPDRYDLILCIEVLEHLSEEEGRQAIANLCKSTDDILFSSTPDDFTEPTHLNVQPRSYWVNMFAEQGFDLDVKFDATFISPQAMRFTRAAVRRHAVDALLEERDRLWQERERFRLENEEKIRATEAISKGLTNRLNEIERSIGWKVVIWLKKVRERTLPAESLRHKGYLALRRVALALMDPGPKSLLSEVWNKSERSRRPEPDRGNGSSSEVTEPFRTTIFPEHALAHSLLDGLKGLEIGAATHNPFGLNTRNVELAEAHEFYANECRRSMGLQPPRVDVWASADNIPVPDQSEGFVLTSHILEHLPNVIAAFVEWNRIVIDGGYIFMIVPHKGALAADRVRELTSLEHFIGDYSKRVTLDSHPVEGVPGGKMGHYHTFTPESVLAIVEWMRQNALCDWQLVAREDIDTKVGNGFALAFRVRHQA